MQALFFEAYPNAMDPKFNKDTGLIPAIIQHAITGQVLMLRQMNEKALKKTMKSKVLSTFDSTKEKQVSKTGDPASRLMVTNIHEDCTGESLLIQVIPTSNVNCQNGAYSCFGRRAPKGYIHQLQALIHSRIEKPEKRTKISRLLARGLNKVAQKVGEETTELIIEAKDDDDKLFINEAADLMLHFTMLLALKGKNFEDVERVLMRRKYQ